jgi:hypothetical protein
MRLSRWTSLVAVAGAALVIAAPALAKNPPHPSGLDQPLKDGCQRSDFGVGLDTSPEWVYVDRDPTIRMARGVVRVSHAAVDDAILQHDWYDFNGNLVPDTAFSYLVAGSRSSETNNYAPPEGGNADEEYARLHFEWESGALPFFAWPTDGDRATIWGSWIWDCGHWSTTENNAEGSTTTGEHTELHPLNAIVVNRKAPYKPTAHESETDVFISSDGTPAHAVEQCALTHKPATSTDYDAGFRPCTQTKANRSQPLLRSYSFFVPAPSKPAAGAQLKYRVVSQVNGGSGTQHVSRRGNGLAVTVTMPQGKGLHRYGKSFFVSWTNDKATPTPLKVTFNSLLVKHADPNPQQPDPTPPAWNLYLDLNGYWQLLNNWAPALYHVTDGLRIPLHRTVRINVPKGRGVWLQVAGRECDEPGDTTVFGLFAHVIKPCGPNRDEINPNPLLLLMNDDTGTILDIFKSPAAALGTHVAKSASKQTFPATGSITLGHGVEGDDLYELSYTISRARVSVKTPVSPPAFTGSAGR